MTGELKEMLKTKRRIRRGRKDRRTQGKRG